VSDVSRGRRATELLGGVTVVASLLFVGFEIRQNAEATRTSTVQEVVDGWREINIWLATDPSWAEALQAFEEANNPSELSFVQRMTLMAGWRTLLHQWMITHYHYTEGVYPKHLWNPTEMYQLVERPSMRWVWETEGPKLSPAFQEFVNRAMGDG
jgi:hypothetical protein